MFFMRNRISLESIRFFSLVTDTMKFQEIIPHVIDEFPLEKVDICYPSGAVVNLGNELTPIQVKDKPILKWNANKKIYYTIIMTDPDAPSRRYPDFREWHHWLVGNIPGSNVGKGKTLSDYIGAGPPAGTGLHRYVFLVYKQPGLINFKGNCLTNTSADHRSKFCTRKFALVHGFGPPIAGNFFQAQWDKYVPVLNKQLNVKI